MNICIMLYLFFRYCVIFGIVVLFLYVCLIIFRFIFILVIFVCLWCCFLWCLIVEWYIVVGWSNWVGIDEYVCSLFCFVRSVIVVDMVYVENLEDVN